MENKEKSPLKKEERLSIPADAQQIMFGAYPWPFTVASDYGRQAGNAPLCNSLICFEPSEFMMTRLPLLEKAMSPFEPQLGKRSSSLLLVNCVSPEPSALILWISNSGPIPISAGG